MIYDVIIAGAGPSGSLLAYKLASEGHSVLVLEKSRFPRYKPCGGGLTQKARKKLPFNINNIIELTTDGGIISFRGKEMLKVKTREPIAYFLSRPEFDQYLIEQAIKVGAKFLESSPLVSFENGTNRICVHTNNINIDSRILVGADGVTSAVASSAGLLCDRETGAAIEAEVRVSAEALKEQGAYATFDFGALPHGYGWIFPKRDHLSIGVFRARHIQTPSLNKHLELFLNNYPVLKNSDIYIRKGHLIPLGGKPNTLHSGRVLLVGDAANLADPWLGEGLNNAFWSASIAAEVISNAFEDGSLDLSNYTFQINHEITSQLKHARFIAKALYLMPHIGSTLLSHSQVMQQLVLGNLVGDLSYRQLNYRLLSALPSILGQTFFHWD